MPHDLDLTTLVHARTHSGALVGGSESDAHMRLTKKRRLWAPHHSFLKGS
uniref:Uncharacterized protein n=1 Tax=Arundo donax TaxID=35708 RepID=A0A0A9EAK6_ARUDO